MSDHPEAEQSPIKTPKQLIVVVVLAFIVPVVMLILLANMAGSVGGNNAGSNARTPEATVQRIAPVAKHEVAQAGAGAVSPVPGAPAVAVASVAPAAGAAPAAAGAQAGGTQAGGAAVGEKLYKMTCVACHGAGIAGAPKVGDKAAWAPYIATGMDTMVAVAIKGKGAMPPKGGAVAASDDDIRAAVQYMVNSSQ